MSTSRLRWQFEAMRRGGQLPRRTPLRRVGKKAQRDRDEMTTSRVLIIHRSGGRCEADGFSPYCSGVGTEAHHVVRRSQGGSNDPSNLLWVCAADHQRIHQYPEAARQRGLLKYGWEAS